MSTVTMVQRHTLADAFTQVNEENTVRGLHAAQQTLGDAAWKAGYSKEKGAAVRSALKEHGAPVLLVLSGRLEDVNCAQTSSGNNTFDKLRVTLVQDNTDKVILTGDMRSEFSQRLLAKLDTATQTAERNVSIGGFAETVTRNGKTFVNHVATLQGENGEEIKATPGHFAKASERGQAAASVLENAGIRQPKVLQEAKDAASIEYFTELAGQIHARMLKEQKIETIEQTGQATGRFVRATEHGADRAHVEMQRAGSSVTVDIPKQALPPELEPGTPIKLRYDHNKGVLVEVGKASQDHSKSRGI